jgi:hypothetical protein
LSNEERDEIIIVLTMRKNYSEEYLTALSDEQLNNLMIASDIEALAGETSA